MKKILILIILALLYNTIIAQISIKKCLTTKLVKKELKINQEYDIMRQNIIKYHQNSKELNHKEKTIITIPVVVHIIHRNSHPNVGSGTNISNAQIEDQIRILNQDYSKTNPEFPNPPRNTFINYAGNPELQFCLASIDPNGNFTTGITRTATSKTSWDADDNIDADAMKRSSSGGINNWEPLRYLNIWVCNLSNSGGGTTAGYAYLPGLQASNQSWKDGLVVDYQYFGTIETAASSDGRTPTHEIGHYLGLEHTFCENTDNQGNPICCDNDNNSWWGGNVDDTPASKDIYFGSVNANTNNNTCNDVSYPNAFNTNVLDMDENYMSYASNTWMFSQGQVEVMLGTLNASSNQGGRRNLWQNSTVSVGCLNSIKDDLSSLALMNVYPNPTKGKLYVDTSEPILSISICDIIGKEVIPNFKNNTQIQLSNLNNGIYFIHVRTNKGIITKQINLIK